MTKGESAIRNPRSAIAWLLFAAATIIVYFSGLTLPLVGPDEPRYAQVAREMFERRDWITPTLGGFNWFEKPALLYWLQIASYNLFGVSEFAARFGSALFGLATIATLWILGRHIERFATEEGSVIDFANWLALVAASTIGIIVFAHGASFDIILTFPITASMVSFYIYDSTRKPAPLILFYFFVGLALLAKGLVGIVFPFAIVAFYFLLSWRFPDRRFMLSLFWGTILAAICASSWYVPMYLLHGWDFIDQFFIQHHFQRYTSNKYLHPQPFYFFLWVLPLMTIPWLPFFIASLWKLAKEVFTDAREVAASRPRSLKLLAFAWLAMPLVFFSFSGSKLPGYILPAVPAAIILAADLIYEFAQKSARRRFLLQGIAGLTLAIVLISVITIAPGFAEADSVKSLFAVAHARGLDGMPVLTMHRFAYNAEFYASGPLLREPDGKQKRLFGPKEVTAEMKKLGKSEVLVLIPPEYLHHLTQSDVLSAEILQKNGEWALTLVNEK